MMALGTAVGIQLFRKFAIAIGGQINTYSSQLTVVRATNVK